MICTVGSEAHGTTRTVFGSGRRYMSESDALTISSYSSMYSPVTVVAKMPSGRRVPKSCENLAAGMILPRALPVMSGTRHSTSVMRCSRSQRLRSLSSRWLAEPGFFGADGIFFSLAGSTLRLLRAGLGLFFLLMVHLRRDSARALQAAPNALNISR